MRHASGWRGRDGRGRGRGRGYHALELPRDVGEVLGSLLRLVLPRPRVAASGGGGAGAAAFLGLGPPLVVLEELHELALVGDGVVHQLVLHGHRGPAPAPAPASPGSDVRGTPRGEVGGGVGGGGGLLAHGCRVGGDHGPLRVDGLLDHGHVGGGPGTRVMGHVRGGPGTRVTGVLLLLLALLYCPQLLARQRRLLLAVLRVGGQRGGGGLAVPVPELRGFLLRGGRGQVAVGGEAAGHGGRLAAAVAAHVAEAGVGERVVTGLVHLYILDVLVALVRGELGTLLHGLGQLGGQPVLQRGHRVQVHQVLDVGLQIVEARLQELRGGQQPLAVLELD